MKVAAFFITLFCILLGGNVNLLAVTGPSSGHRSSTLHTQQQAKVTFTNILQDKALITNTSFPKQDQLLICEEVEDEDVSNLSTKKCKPVVGIHSQRSYPSIFTFHEQRAKPVPFGWRPIAARYILLHSLRI